MQSAMDQKVEQVRAGGQAGGLVQAAQVSAKWKNLPDYNSKRGPWTPRTWPPPTELIRQRMIMTEKEKKNWRKAKGRLPNLVNPKDSTRKPRTTKNKNQKKKKEEDEEEEEDDDDEVDDENEEEENHQSSTKTAGARHRNAGRLINTIVIEDSDDASDVEEVVVRKRKHESSKPVEADTAPPKKRARKTTVQASTRPQSVEPSPAETASTFVPVKASTDPHKNADTVQSNRTIDTALSHRGVVNTARPRTVRALRQIQRAKAQEKKARDSTRGRQDEKNAFDVLMSGSKQM